ncbi:MAG: folate-binding protein YgfZ [Gammaproteobacteria bacterium]|jgi:folate-binding protein YgfZ
MIPEWKAFLENAGAEFSDGGVQHYGNLRRELSVAITGNVFADLSHYGLISVHGDDAQAFLQGQLTNDVTGVDEAHSQLSGYCNAKGRLLATFRLFRRGDSHYLCLPTEMVEGLIGQLRMFVLRSQVTLEDADDTFVHLGVSGSASEEELRSFAGEIPERLHEVRQDERQTIIRVPGIHPSFEIFTDPDRAMELWTRLNVRSAAIGSEAWRLLDIEAGIPMMYPETREAFVPQMVNLQLVDGVSFKKGCYPGQEIVARMQYLGKLKRRMYRVRIDTESTPPPGEDIYSADDDNQSIGTLVSAAPHPDGGHAALAVLQIAVAERGSNLHLGGTGGPLITLESLPYPFPAG